MNSEVRNSAAVERQIAATDKQTDALVYELYGLTEDESRVVEGAADSVRPAAGLESGGR